MKRGRRDALWLLGVGLGMLLVRVVGPTWGLLIALALILAVTW